MTYLPATPAEARAIPLASLPRAAVDEALAQIRKPDARRAMARLIAEHGREYTADARACAAGLA